MSYEELQIALENIIIEQGIHSPDNQTEEVRQENSCGSQNSHER